MPTLGTQFTTDNPATADGYGFDNQPHIFTFSDSYKLAIFRSGAAASAWRSYSGSVWSSETALANDICHADAFAPVQNGNVVYAVWAKGGSAGIINLFLETFTWNASTHAMTSVTHASYTLTVPNGGADFKAACVDAWWDSTHSALYVPVFGIYGNLSVFTFNTSLVKLSSQLVTTTGNASAGERCQLAGASAAATSLLLVAKTGSNNNASAWPITAGTSGTFTVGAGELVSSNQNQAGPAFDEMSLQFDSSNRADLVYADNTGHTIGTIKRTGTATWTSPTTLAGTNGSTAPACVYNSSTGDLWVHFTTYVNQANGEIAVVKRTSGAWGSSSVLIGTDASGYDHCTAGASIQSGNADLLYTYGTSPWQLWYENIGTTSAPYAPAPLTPAGYVGSNAPTFSFTYSNPVTTDTQGAYQIQVVRVSDLVSFWDSGTVSSASSSGIAYAGTTLVYGTQYKWRARTQDSGSSTFGSYSSYTTFTPIHSPVAAITAITPTGGTQTSGAASSTLNGATLAAATSLAVQTGQGSRFTNGKQVSVGVSPTIDLVTIGTISGDTIPVTAMTHAHSNTDPVVESDSTVAALTAPTFTLNVDVQEADGNHINAYQATVYAADGVTVTDQDSKRALSPDQAPGTQFTTAQFLSSHMVNGQTYKFGCTVWDTTTGLSTQSTLWPVTAGFTLPGTPTNPWLAVNNDAGNVVLTWVNGSNTSTNNVYWRVHGVTAWTLLASGTLRTSATLFPPPGTAYDYQVTGVSTYGIESTAAQVPNQTLGLKYGKYAVWLNDLTNPSGSNVALGTIDQVDFSNATGWDHIEDEVTVLPMGRARPITNFGRANYWEAVGRKYTAWTDTGSSGVTTTAQTIVANLATIVANGNPLLYRDISGEYRYVLMTKFHKEVVDGVGWLVTFTLRETDNYNAGPPVV